MPLSIVARFAMFLLLLGCLAKGWALEYAYGNAALVVNDRGAWVKNKGSRIALIPQFNDTLRGVLSGGQYKSIRKQAILVSLVGPYASFRIIKSALPDGKPVSAVARPEGQVLMRVIDIRHPLQPQSPVSLLDIFTESQVRSALEKSPDEDLRSAYSKFDKRFKLDAFAAIGLPADGDFLYEFAFDESDRNTVDIKIQMKSPGFGDGLDRDIFFTLKLKRPEMLDSCLERASNKSAGYLVSNSRGDNERPSFFFK
jgi:hypothetical protein